MLLKKSCRNLENLMIPPWIYQKLRSPTKNKAISYFIFSWLLLTKIHFRESRFKEKNIRPLIFSLFINDLPTGLNFCSVHLIADNVRILIRTDENTDLSSARYLMNHDLHKVMKWSRENLLPINPDKTKAMLIYKKKLLLSHLKFYLMGSKSNLLIV